MTERMTAAQARAELAKHDSQQPETAIRKQIVDYLRATGWMVVYHMQGPLSYKGFSDLTALKDGRVYFLEVKTAKGKLSEHQQRFAMDVAEHGGEYRVVRSLEDVVRL